MANSDAVLAPIFLAAARRALVDVYLPRIDRCLGELSAEEIWWRPNPASNSVGNLVLHLEGNVRQWIVSGLGGARDTRQRDREFQERGPLPRRVLLTRLRTTVRAACRVMDKLTPADLAREYSIQGFCLTGLQAAFHVTEHFSHHAGQIILATKLIRGKDLEFTHLPGDQKRGRSKSVPAI